MRSCLKEEEEEEEKEVKEKTDSDKFSSDFYMKTVA